MPKVLFSLLFVACTALNAMAQKGFEIKIKIKGYNEPMMFIGNYFADKEYVKDSAARDKKGYYVFKGTEALGCGIYEAINSNRDRRLFEFIVNPNEQFFTLETDTAKTVENMKATGSPENQKYYEYQRYIETNVGPRFITINEAMRKNGSNADSIKYYRELKSAVDKELSEYRENFMKQNPGNVVTKLFRTMKEPEVPPAPINADGSKDSTFQYRYYKAHYWDNFDFSDDCLLRSPLYHKRLENYITRLTFQIPDSINATADIIVAKTKNAKETYKYTVGWITNHYGSSNIMCMDAVYVHMGLKYYTYKDAWWADTATIERIRTQATKTAPLCCGKIAPNLQHTEDTAGKYRELHKVNARYTVVVFWEPDCHFCRNEIPKLKTTYDKLKSYGLEVFAVTTEQEPVKWKKFIVDHKLDWINVQDRYGERVIYNIDRTPMIFLLDKDKKILAKQLTVEQVQDLLEREFGLKDRNAPLPEYKGNDLEKDHQ